MSEATTTPDGWGVRTDPRTKLVLLVLTATSVFLASSWRAELMVMLLTSIFAIISGRVYPLVMVVLYTLATVGMSASAGLESGTWKTMLLTFFMMIRKVFPSVLMAAIVISTTRVDEFMAALGRLHAPRSLVIPLAVMLRYLPAVREDWRFIRDAMRMRGISPTPWGLVRAPSRTLECVYVPMLMSASNTADELSMAAVARGIENPLRPTCLTELRFRAADGVVLAVGVIALVAIIWGAP